MRVIAKVSAPSIVGWLEKGKCLTVLALSVAPHEEVKFLLWSDKQESVALFPGIDFDVVDGRLSQRWVFNLDSQGFVNLAPKLWLLDNFWEKYHDGDLWAERVFEQEKALVWGEFSV